LVYYTIFRTLTSRNKTVFPEAGIATLGVDAPETNKVRAKADEPEAGRSGIRLVKGKIKSWIGS
jgi:hypothetical protein